METLIIVALVGVVAWFFLSGTYRTRVKDPETLRDPELEDVFIEIKKQLLVTSAYEHEQTYQRLYFRISAVLGQIIERHKHFILDVEAQAPELHRIFVPRERHEASGIRYTDYAVPRGIDMDSLRPDVLLYLCFFLWLGGQAKDIGNIESDSDLMLKVLEHLITQRNYPQAYFFKGMVLKYGVKVYEQSKPDEARTLLEAAQKQGVGSAAEELRHLHKFTALEGIKSVHF